MICVSGQISRCKIMSLENTEAKFSVTHWTSVIVPASRESAQALEELCLKYWYPLYAYLRRQGRSPEDSKDLTQGFFAHLLTNKALAKVDRAKGKFRNFLLRRNRGAFRPHGRECVLKAASLRDSFDRHACRRREPDAEFSLRPV